MLLKEIIKEEHETKIKLPELFKQADEAGNLKSFVSALEVQIRDAVKDEEIHVHFPGSVTGTKHAKEGEYVVRNPENINQLKIISAEEFDDYEEVDETPNKDAEGYNTYRLSGEVQAFEYVDNEPLELKDERGHVIHIKHGDYLGYPSDDSTTLIKLSKDAFEKAYRLEG
jgi:hypothetical protein